MDIKTLKKAQKGRKPAGKASFSLKRLAALANRDIRLFKGLNDRNKERFFSEVGMLLSAGVDMQTVLDLAERGSKTDKKLNQIYSSIAQQITHGAGLSQAMENTGQFNNFDCYSVLIGENTGELSAIFGKLQHYYSKKIIQKRKIAGALSYPAIVMTTTIGAVFFMLRFVVPMFAETILRFGGELPLLTEIVIAFSHTVTTYFLAIFSIIILTGYWYYRNKDKPKIRQATSAVLLKLPYIGKMLRKIHISQFCQAMDLLLSAHVGLVESIHLTHKMVRFYPLSKALEEIENDLQKGMFFYKSMERQAFFDNAMITLVKIGEEINQLDKIFMQLTKQYESELDYQSNQLITILEPLMLLILALVIGTILIAMYLPMFRIGTVVH